MSDLINLVVVDGQPRTTSLKIAAHFGKLHKDVLRAIDNLECSSEFTERNFAPSAYKDSTGRTLPLYSITKNGFVFLAMGFTGKEAALWKERYIEAFDAMAARLHAETKPPMVGMKLHLSADAKRLINQRAQSIGGRTYFQDIRRHILRMVEQHLLETQPSGDDWLEEFLGTVNIDSVYRSHLATEALR